MSKTTWLVYDCETGRYVGTTYAETEETAIKNHVLSSARRLYARKAEANAPGAILWFKVR